MGVLLISQDFLLLDLLTEAEQQEALTRIEDAIVEAEGINSNGRPEVSLRWSG